MAERCPVVVVGGGQAGLAMSHELKSRGIEHVVLEASSAPGAAWRGRWQSLRLFTPAAYSGLPGMPFPGDPEGHPSAAEVATYLGEYTRRHGLPVRFGERVLELEAASDGRGFRLRTERTEYRAEQVVVATGPFQRPKRPPYAAELSRAVHQLHSSEYRSPEDLDEGDVLVVGAANSGIQVAEEVARTRPTRLAVGSRLPALPETVLGRNLFSWLDRTGAMDVPVTSRLGRRMSRRDFLVGGSLARRARAAGIELVERIVACRHEAVLTEDLRVVRPANVIWATGFAPDFSWIRLPVFDDQGHPVHTRGVTEIPGIHFLGLSWLHTRGSALLGWVGRDAAYLADWILKRRPHTYIGTTTIMRGNEKAVSADVSVHDSRSAANTSGSGPVTRGGRTVEVELEARPGAWRMAPDRTADGWTYNGQVPGPVIECDVGDTLVVRLTNRLSEPTTIHWHGLRVPAAMDGTSAVQREVEPGETFEYRFALPDAGTFWYHPHANEPVQMERGLYGAVVVRDPADPVVDGERVLIFDDVRLDQRGRIAPPGGWLERHNGRQGPVRLLNGEVDPEIVVAAGQIERWRLVNAASARYVRLSLGGRTFQILATDGGLLETPVDVTEVLLTPGDRFDLAIGPFESGETFAIESLPYRRGVGKAKPERFGRVRVGAARPSRASIPQRLREIPSLAEPSAPASREVRLGGRMSLRRGVDFLIDGEPHSHGAPVRVGDVQVWDVVNETPLDHPFHLHGFFFQVLDENGAPPAYRSWEDTVNVPAKGRVRIAWMPDDRPGPWMYHCHILEHAVAGMMSHFEVVPRR